jgi:membrane-bound serine protease (ClpP class)
LCFALLIWAIGSSSVEAQTVTPIYYATLDHGLTVPAATMVRRALREAEAADATALVVEVRGGGVVSAAWPLARELASAGVPVVTFIAPQGVQSGPIGTLLLSASHVAVMAPGTSVGFAQPLVDVPTGFSGATQQLIVDDAVNQLTNWSRMHGRNADWVEQAVRSGAIINAERARELEPPVIDLVATRDELLPGLQGRQVTLESGEERTLQTLGAEVRHIGATVWEGLGQIIALPTVAFVLFILGGIAVYLELANPGIGIPGVSGALLIVAAMSGFVLGEVRPLAVVLLALGLVLVGLEHVVMSHGGLTLGGLIAVVLGALYLVDSTRAPGLNISYGVIGGVAMVLVTAAVGMVFLAFQTRSHRPTTGQDALIGQIAEVRRSINPEGKVFVNGALWTAWTDQGAFEVGELVEVAGVEGLRLYVCGVEQTEE